MNSSGSYVREFTAFALLGTSVLQAAGFRAQQYPVALLQPQAFVCYQPQEETEAERIPLDLRLVERELRKWGPWVEELVESDYTDGERTKPVSLYTSDQDATPLRVYNFMSYDHEKDAVRVPQTIRKKCINRHRAY